MTDELYLKFLGVTAWHEAGYTGGRVKAASVEDDTTLHGRMVDKVFHLIAPETPLSHVCLPYGVRCADAEHGDWKGVLGEHKDICVLTSSLSQSYLPERQLADIDDVLDGYPLITFVQATGNEGSERYAANLCCRNVFGVGAFRLYEALNGVELDTEGFSNWTSCAFPSTSTSWTEHVDFASLTGVCGFQGTSCAAPVLAGMIALINDMAVERSGAPLDRTEMYRFLADNCTDIGDDGKDIQTGRGVFRLPAPERVDILAYTKSRLPEKEQTAEAEKLSVGEYALSLAAADVGYTETPPYSNRQKYGEWYGWNGVPWCCMAVQYWYSASGFVLPIKTASCSALEAWYKMNKPECIVEEPTAGDIVIYNFGHTGLVEQDLGGCITAIEGNTSIDSKGNQSDGGGVFRRQRSKATVSSFIRPVLAEEENMTQDKFNELMDSYLKEKAGEPLPEWAADEFAEAVTVGITDGTSPMQLIPRYQAALMALRAVKLAENKVKKENE